MKKPLAFVLLLVACAAHGQSLRPFGAQVGGRQSPSGAPIQIDLPGALHLHNKAGTDRAGLCVFSSMDMAGVWASIPALIGMRDYMTKFPGGGWPEKVDEYIKRRCAELKVPVPRYIHVRKTDLEILKRATATGRMPCVTYCYSPTGRYNGQHISHMVNLSHCDNQWFAVLDNNYEGENRYEWMSPAEFARVTASGGQMWGIIFLDHGPPPPLVASNVAPKSPLSQKDDGL